MDLTIDYCTDCGHLDKAVEIVREVMDEYDESFEKAELVPSDGGVLRVSIESEIVFDLDEDEFSIDDIKRKVAEQLEGE